MESELTLIIPTFNERENIAPLLAQIGASLGDTAWDVLFVDDSNDGTDKLIAELTAADGRIHLLHREDNRGGLAGAVVDGLKEAHGEYLCVLDADLQHPPALIPRLLDSARQNTADVVVASRYRPGGGAGGLSGPLRQAYSQGLRRLTQVVFPSRLQSVTDPLSGYFLVRRRVIEGVDLRPIGYKILLEILVRCRWQRATEVPYRFEPRRAGSSKADLSQGLRFLQHLATLLWDCSPVSPGGEPTRQGRRVK